MRLAYFEEKQEAPTLRNVTRGQNQQQIHSLWLPNPSHYLACPQLK